MAAEIPLSEAVEEYLNWLELDRHAAEGTVAEYRHDLERLAYFAGGDALERSNYRGSGIRRCCVLNARRCSRVGLWL
jgi:site-specific recombinase XerC